MRRGACLAALLAALALGGGCRGGAAGPLALFERTCSRCHGTDVALRQDFDGGLWEAVVRTMSDKAAKRFGKPIPEADQREIAEYLSKNAGGR